ncbi:ATP-binding cassette domain-containing protein [Serratia ureilytica]
MAQQDKDINLQLKHGEIQASMGWWDRAAVNFSILSSAFSMPTAARSPGRQDAEPPLSARGHRQRYCLRDGRSQETGLVLCRSVSENINIASFAAISRMGFVSEKREQARTRDMIQRFNVKTHDGEQPVGNLSGGNQQKVVLGRWALLDPEVLLLDEPTRGIDVGAKRSIDLCRSSPCKTKGSLWFPPSFRKLSA